MGRIAIRNTDEPIGTSGHFKMREFFSRSVDAPSEHELDERVILFAEIIRERYGATVINSTFRTLLGNSMNRGAKDSQHMKGMAIDLRPSSLTEFERFRKELSENAEIVQVLTDAGMKGLGFYNTFIHLDCRDGVGARWDNTAQGFLAKMRSFTTGKGEPGDDVADVRLMAEEKSGIDGKWIVYGLLGMSGLMVLGLVKLFRR